MRRLLPLFVVAILITGTSFFDALAAESFLFSNLPVEGSSERSVLSAYCEGDPKKDQVLNCRLIQQRLQPGLSKEEVEKKKTALLAEMKNPKELARSIKSSREMCAALANPSSAMKLREPEHVRAAVAIAELRKFCEAKDVAAAMLSFGIKGIEKQATQCLVLPSNEWKEQFVRYDANTFKTKPGQNGQCGAVTVQTIQFLPDATSLWKYAQQRVYLDRSSPVCEGLPEKIELKFSWDAFDEFPMQCTSLKFGLTR